MVTVGTTLSGIAQVMVNLGIREGVEEKSYPGVSGGRPLVFRCEYALMVLDGLHDGIVAVA